MDMRRRNLLKVGFMTSAVAATLSWRAVFSTTTIAPGPYGALGAPDVDGVRVPAGFAVRKLATTNQLVAGSNYVWHGEPDGAACFARETGGWVYASNSELNGNNGGAGVLSFDANGNIDDAYRILGGTKWNCSGGATPWNTWLSCEETRGGVVWECDPFAPGQGIARPALGKFPHEAAVVDPATGFVYLTEDHDDSRLYRFRPHVSGDLRHGMLEAAAVTAPVNGKRQVTWVEVNPNRPYRGRDTTAFSRGEGAWFAAGVLYFCTTSDHRVWALDTTKPVAEIEIIYDAAELGVDAPLREPDNITVHLPSGDVYVAEDADDLQLVLLANSTTPGDRIVAPFLQFVGHSGSEVAGPAFSPDGTRLYVSSQRGTDGKNGMTFEITGPFRT